jgi:C-terminal duplication domain of Friend of PRMT1
MAGNRNNTKTKKLDNKKGKKNFKRGGKPNVSADSLDRQLLNYMGDKAKGAVLDDQLDLYFKTTNADE